MILIEKIWWKIFQKKSSRILNYTKYVRRLEKLCKSRILEINEILEIAKQAYILLYKFIELWDKQKGLRYEDTNITLFVKDQSLKIVRILTDLRSDLTLRLAEQQKTLEWAKSDVEMNIVWTPELNEVSELQKARLDRQIEQFEELQKVLVEV